MLESDRLGSLGSCDSDVSLKSISKLPAHLIKSTKLKSSRLLSFQ